MGVTTAMPMKVLKHIKNIEEVLGVLRQEFEDNPLQMFTITIKPEIYSEDDMPPEEMISEGLIKAVEESEMDIKAGRYTICKTREESEIFFNKILNE